MFTQKEKKLHLLINKQMKKPNLIGKIKIFLMRLEEYIDRDIKLISRSIFK